MKFYKFWLVLFSVVGITYALPVVEGYLLWRLHVRYPWNVMVVLLSMTLMVLVMFYVAFREDRLVHERPDVP